MTEHKDLPLFKWGEEERQKRLVEEKIENEVEEQKLHEYGPGRSGEQIPKIPPETQAQMIERHIAERAAARSIPPDAQEKMDKLKLKAEEERKKREGN